jgi:membrane-anchored protein YejM (alkaline phosphatase superfamily)
MKKSGNLDNTLLVVMGDHGIRYGAIRKTILGKLEERLPLLSISVPNWFKEKYPDFVRNLQTNTDRLTSPYDLHATLQQILSQSHKKTYSYGQSLFTEISKSRTCKQAGNPEHFCPCIDWKPVDPRHKHLQQIGEETVRLINQVSKHFFVCY